MPKKKRASTARRPVEEEEVEQDEPMNGNDDDDNGEQEDDDMQDDEGDDEDEEMEEKDDEDDSGEEEAKKKASPSPRRKRDMTLRSGKRKRARSKDTSGLTPPEQQGSPTRASKRSRKSTTVAATASATAKRVLTTQRKRQQQTAAEGPTPAAKATTNGELLNSTTGATPNSQSSPAGVPDPRRISYAAGARRGSTAAAAAAAAPTQQDDEDQDEINVQAPPPVNGRAAAATITATTTVTRTEVVVETAATAANENDNAEPAVEETAVEEQPDDDTPEVKQSRMIFRLGVMGVLSLFIFVLYPLVVGMASWCVPLDASILPPKIDVTEIKEIVTEEVDLPAHELEAWNRNFAQNLETLQTLQETYRKDSQVLSERYNYFQRGIRDLLDIVKDQNWNVHVKVKQLTELESLLFNDIATEGEHSEERWDRMQSMAQQVVGKPLVDASSVRLWDIAKVNEESCANSEESVTVEDDAEVEEAEAEPLLTTKLLQEKESDLLLRAQMSAEKIMTGTVARNRIRKHIETTIQAVVSENSESEAATIRISELANSAGDVPGQDSLTSSSGESTQSGQDVENAIQSRLEVDRADTTGVFDHASLKNGAEIIYGGKRGTSKSLIDYFPLYNRLLQSANLRFYGFGPEAALTPSYPPNALGQCWSFQQASLKEQLEERGHFQSQEGVPNDFRRGSVGTLTISFQNPVFVNSVVIEHVPQRLTDRADSAIRSFRVVGYEDDSAEAEAWNLGSFEYSIQKNGNYEYLQEFEVATTSKGEEIPSLLSISLAVDSNWGNDYACLYRFRVHGDIDPEVEDD